MGNSTLTAASRVNGVEKEVSQKKIFEEKLKQEKRLLDKFRQDFEKRKRALFKKIDIEQVTSLIQAEKKVYDTAVKNFKGDPVQLERLKTIARKVSRDQLIKKSPAIGEIIELYRDGSKQFHNILHSAGSNVFNSELNFGLEVATAEQLESQLFEPPFAFRDGFDTATFDYDYSLSFPPWGLILTDVKFSNSQDYFAAALARGDDAYKYGIRAIGLGVNYLMPRNGNLEITFVLQNLYYNVDYSITDHFGPSHAHLEFSNIFLMSAKGITPAISQSMTIFEDVRSSSGDDKSGSFVPALPNAPLYVTFKTTQGFSAGEYVAVQISSSVHIASSVLIMKTSITANTLWHVQKIYVKVI